MIQANVVALTPKYSVQHYSYKTEGSKAGAQIIRAASRFLWPRLPGVPKQRQGLRGITQDLKAHSPAQKARHKTAAWSIPVLDGTQS